MLPAVGCCNRAGVCNYKQGWARETAVNGSRELEKPRCVIEFFVYRDVSVAARLGEFSV